MKSYWVYITMNKNDSVIYTGVTNDLVRRIFEHKSKLIKGFTEKYNIVKLVYFEGYNDINQAIAREKQIKGWLRKKKIELIKTMNLEFKDLYDQIIQ